MRRVRRGRAILALAAWLLPLAGTTATGLHLAFEGHHLPALSDSAGPASLRAPAHTHEPPDQAPAIAADTAPRLRTAQASSLVIVATAAFDAPRSGERRGFAARAGPGPDPAHLATGHSVLRI